MKDLIDELGSSLDFVQIFICIVLIKISDIIHFKPLFLISFTEYSSSPSIYIYVGDEQEGSDAEDDYLRLVLDSCFVAS